MSLTAKQDRQRSDSIGRTVLQTVAPELANLEPSVRATEF